MKVTENRASSYRNMKIEAIDDMQETVLHEPLAVAPHLLVKMVPKNKFQATLAVVRNGDTFACLMADLPTKGTEDYSIVNMKIIRIEAGNTTSSEVGTELSLNEPMDKYLFAAHPSKAAFLIASAKGKLVQLNTDGVAVNYATYATAGVSQMKFEGNFLLWTGKEGKVLSVYDTINNHLLASITNDSKVLDFTCLRQVTGSNTDILLVSILNELGRLLVFRVSTSGIKLIASSTYQLPAGSQFCGNNYEFNHLCSTNQFCSTKKSSAPKDCFFLQLKLESRNLVLKFTNRTASNYEMTCRELGDEKEGMETIVPSIQGQNEIVSLKNHQLYGRSVTTGRVQQLVQGEFSEVKVFRGVLLLTNSHSEEQFILTAAPKI